MPTHQEVHEEFRTCEHWRSVQTLGLHLQTLGGHNPQEPKRERTSKKPELPPRIARGDLPHSHRESWRWPVALLKADGSSERRMGQVDEGCEADRNHVTLTHGN